MPKPTSLDSARLQKALGHLFEALVAAESIKDDRRASWIRKEIERAKAEFDEARLDEVRKAAQLRGAIVHRRSRASDVLGHGGQLKLPGGKR